MSIAKKIPTQLNKLLENFCRSICMRAKIVSEKGTSSKEIDVEPSKWVGRDFFLVQDEFMASLPRGTIISLGKGTGRVHVCDYPKSIRKIPMGDITVSINKGTSTYKLP